MVCEEVEDKKYAFYIHSFNFDQLQEYQTKYGVLIKGQKVGGYQS